MEGYEGTQLVAKAYTKASTMMWRSWTERLLRTFPFLAALSAVSTPAPAQVVQGRLLDEATGQPVAAVAIQLLGGDEGDSTVATDVTDDQGHFMLRAPSFGAYQLQTLRIGYQPVTTQLFVIVRERDLLEVEVRISAVAVPLEPLTIVSERAARSRSLRLEITGYYEREEIYGSDGLGLGEFLGREELLRDNPYKVSDALRMVRGVRVVGGGGRRQVITLRAHGGLSPTGRCIPQVYINGSPFATGRDIDEMVSPWSLAGAEVYPGLTVPAEFTRGAMACGVIALWTGYAESDSANPEPAPLVTDQALVAESTQLALRLTIDRDSVTWGDTLQVSLTVSNLSDEARSLCVLESRYTLRGPGTNRDIVQNGEQDECIHDAALAAHASHSWQDAVTFTSKDRPGEILLQTRFLVRYQPCGDGVECEVQLRSQARWFSVYRDGGGL